ncbi:MAG: hypothetical protein JST24_02330 [Acidobacteria bacterium]|nr:hypothetical protein [Acidobacteriota bacterium]
MLLLLLLSLLYFKLGEANIFVARGAENPVMRAFALRAILTEILPIYLGSGLILFVLGMIPVRLGWLGSGRWNRWTGRSGFWAAFGFLTLLHAMLWWAVPSTLWVLPGISSLPLALGLFVVFAAALASWWAGLRPMGPSALRMVTLMGLWWGLCVAYLAIPRNLAQSGLDASPSGHPVKVLMLSIDGMREDAAFQQGFDHLEGFKVVNGYTAIPATRLEWSILWGGDPNYYSVGNVIPSDEELEGHKPYLILEAAKAKGLKTRFFIDDGGTIGLVDKERAFDLVEMPARGWENFLNSNVSVHVPLFAAWLNTLRVFPTTNPWTPLDLGIRRTLADGRGADWVIFHSCLAHQPIFLDRQELSEIPGWWKARPKDLAPTWADPTPDRIHHYLPAYNPYLAYQIRIHSLIGAWGTLWNQLDRDPDYGPALRVFMTDHGERFQHLNAYMQAGGVHGFQLDPWEARIPLAFAGPGISSGKDSEHAFSLLTLRDAVANRLLNDTLPDLTQLLAKDSAVMRLQALDMLASEPGKSEFKQISTEEIIQGSKVLPDGLWIMHYLKPATQRAEDLSLGIAHGNKLDIYRPLKVGGARLFHYTGYVQTSTEDISEEAFQAARSKINAIYTKPWGSSTNK